MVGGSQTDYTHHSQETPLIRDDSSRIVLFHSVFSRYTQSLKSWEIPIPQDELHRSTTHIYIEDSANDKANNTS